MRSGVYIFFNNGPSIEVFKDDYPDATSMMWESDDNGRWSAVYVDDSIVVAMPANSVRYVRIVP